MLCRFHPLTDKVGVLVHKVYDALVVFGVLVVLAVALHHLECPQIHLYGFNYLTANPCREYEGVGFLVVFTAEHADVLCLALAVILVYAFKYLDDYFLVSDYQSEEFGFVGNEILRIFCSRSRLSISQRRRCSARSFSCMASIFRVALSCAAMKSSGQMFFGLRRS